ncbi:hypothetical protein EDD15DRAFT_1598484 [Pisolithus albus]|nr:hypothetical protein EDD15DRAFT_1598484 [Pisolithus albus]
MSSNPSRLAKKAARKKYGSTDGPSDTGAHPISTPGLSSGEDSSVVPSTRGPDSSTGIPTGGTVHLRNLATKSARKVTTALPSTASRHSTIDDDSDPPSTRSLSLSDTTTSVGTRPLSVAVKASRKVAFRDLPPASSRRSDVELSAPSGHHGRILASDELTTHRPQDRAGAMLSRTDQRNGQSQGTRVSDRRARDLGDYRPSRSTTTTDIATAEQRKWMNRHISRELIPDGVTRQRVSRIATGRQSKKTGAEEQGRNTGGRHFRVSKRKSYLVEGKFVSPRPDGSSSTNDDTSDESEESTEGQPEWIPRLREKYSLASSPGDPKQP